MRQTKADMVSEMRSQMEELSEFLPYGYVKMVQAKMDKTVAPETIYAVRSGQRDTVSVLAAILQVAKDERDKIQNALRS